MTTTWILVADAHRARCFAQTSPSAPLKELYDFVRPQAHSGGDDKGHGRTGHAGTQLEPATDAAAKERQRFAHQLAEYLNRGVDARQCASLALIATSPMVGAIKPLLSPAAHRLLQRNAAIDLTHYQGLELQQRVQEVLGLPG